MKNGKISDSILKRSVLKKCRTKHPAVLQGAGAGQDSAVFSLQQEKIVSAAVQPELLEDKKMIGYTLEHAVNNLACSGCLPAAVLLTVLLPQDAQEKDLKEIMDEAEETCKNLGIQIAGGHTQVTDAVKRPVFNVTAIGFGSQDRAAGKTGAGKELVMTGFAGLEGTALLARARRDELCRRFPVDFVEHAKSYADRISIVKEAFIAWEKGAALLHDASQGGIFGALWELCEKAGCGMEANLRLIPIKQETIEICEYFGLNPYCLKSGGALLIAAESGEELVAELAHRGIPACVIGRLTDSNDRILLNGEEKRFLDKPAQDEYFRWKDMENGKA